MQLMNYKIIKSKGIIQLRNKINYCDKLYVQLILLKIINTKTLIYNNDYKKVAFDKT